MTKYEKYPLNCKIILLKLIQIDFHDSLFYTFQISNYIYITPKLFFAVYMWAHAAIIAQYTAFQNSLCSNTYQKAACNQSKCW